MAGPNEERTIEIIVNGQRANASLKEMDAAVAVLNAQFRKMAADDPGRAKLLADLQAMRARVATVRQEVAGVAETTGLMKQAFANAFALFTGGGLIGLAQQLFSFFADSRQEALASAKSSADLDNTLKSTAHAAGLTAAEIRKIGEERAKVTLFDDDETNQASALLLTFTNIKKGVFEQAMPAIQDLATKMGGDSPADMKGATIQLGKALNDPIKGITALTRVGVSFTEAQKEQITQMVKAGDVAGAQKLILAEMNKEFGGTAEAAREAAGGVATLSMWFNEFKETVGGKVNQVFDALSQWLGRVIEKSQPLVDMVSELVDEFAAYYHEIADILVSLGLFNEKTDTASLFVQALKVALTLLLIPIRHVLQVSKAVVDTFIDWYNKSELLRGVLGGLGAAAKSIFFSLKDDAIQALGGLSDLLIGIFTLDKDKIMAGYKAAMSVTADLAYRNGVKAAGAFVEGYQSNKDNLIVRTQVQVRTEEEKLEKVGPVKSDAAGGETAAEKKAREAKELKARLEAIEAEKKHQLMLLDVEQQGIKERGSRRASEMAQIELDAERKTVVLVAAEKAELAKLTGTAKEKAAKKAELEKELAAQIDLLFSEANEAQLRKQEEYRKQDEEAFKKGIEQKLADIEAGEVEQEAALEAAFEEGLKTEKDRNRDLWNVRLSAADAKLNLLETTLGKESAAYRKAYKEQEKLNRDANKAKSDEDKKAHKAKVSLEQASMSAASDVLSFTLSLLDQDAEARKKHHGLYVTLAAAKIIVDGVKEVQQIWEYQAENPLNGETMGIAGITMGTIQTAIAVARTGVALNQVFKTDSAGSGGGSYAQGGATGTGVGLAGSPVGQLLAMTGLRVAGDGRLRDGSGFAVAGVVHEDEYVIPKWQLQDPQVAAVTQWLEARRLRGYDGGGHTPASSGAALPVAAASPSSDGEKLYAVMAQVLDANLAMVQQLGDVKAWQRNLQVQLNLRDAQARTDVLKQVQYDSAIRSKK